MRALTLAILMTLVAPSHAAVTVIKDATGRSVTAHSRQLLVHAGGRVAVSPLAPLSPKSALAYFHQWPAVYWEAAFAGDQLMLKFDDEKNEYRLTIDDAAVVPIPQPGAAVIVVRGLGPGRHRVRLDKVTESVEFVRAFDGFFVSPGESALPAPLPRSRQIEFVGDSGMTGYGVRSASRTCTKEEVRLRTDSSSAWPSLVAHTIDADYQINAISGRGLVRNYGGVEPARVMSALYPRILPDRPAVWQDRSWHPEVMVIVLFNDFATTLQPGERWPDQVALAADYVKAYQQFVTSLHQRAPRATFGVAVARLRQECRRGNAPTQRERSDGDPCGGHSRRGSPHRVPTVTRVHIAKQCVRLPWQPQRSPAHGGVDDGVAQCTTGDLGYEPGWPTSVGRVMPLAQSTAQCPLFSQAGQKLPDRSPEEFRMPLGVRKSWKPEPAGHARCFMGI